MRFRLPRDREPEHGAKLAIAAAGGSVRENTLNGGYIATDEPLVVKQLMRSSNKPLGWFDLTPVLSP